MAGRKDAEALQHATGQHATGENAADRPTPLRLRFDRSTHPAVAARVAAWRDAMAPTSDLVFRPSEREDLAASLDVHRLGAVVLVVSNCSPVTAVRDRRVLARTGYTNVILDLFTAGRVAGTVGGRPAAFGPGDCLLLDLKGTFRLHVAGRYIGVVMPRAALEARCGTLGGLHGLRFPAGAAEARILAPLLESAAAEAPRLTAAGAAALGDGLLALIGSLLGAAVAAPAAAAQPRAAVPTAIRVRHHIERHAADPALDAPALCAAFGLSRTALYRLLGSDGGVAAAIRERRVVLARRLLAAPDRAAPSVEAVALACGFGNARALRRALRAAGDAPPSHLRRAPLDPEAGTREHRVAIGAWLDP